jgi:hypothetical protein
LVSASGGLAKEKVERPHPELNSSKKIAGLAQLVEHLLAKEKVEGPSPLTRSIIFPETGISGIKSPRWTGGQLPLHPANTPYFLVKVDSKWTLPVTFNRASLADRNV